MKQIKYDEDNLLRLEIPPEWDLGDLSAIDCEIRDTDGNILQAAANATLYAGDTLASAASSGDITITLTTGTALTEGDRIRIAGSITEDRTVISYIASTKVVTLDTVLDYDHTASGTVTGLFATASLDATDTDVFTKNKQLVISWNPVGIDWAPYTELAEIAEVGEFSPADFDVEFAKMYPREYEDFRDRLDTVREMSERKLAYKLQSRGLNMDRVVDQNVLMDALLSLTRWNMIKGNGDDWEFEIGSAKTDFNNDFEDLVSLPIWADDNQDETKDDDEVKSFQSVFIERNM